MQAIWITPAQHDYAQSLGFTVVDQPSVSTPRSARAWAKTAALASLLALLAVILLTTRKLAMGRVELLQQLEQTLLMLPMLQHLHLNRG